jgi:predicted RNA-binding protein with PIN domain
MNVIGSRPDGWWKDRDGACRRFLTRLQSLARRTDEQIVLVLDGRPVPEMPEGDHEGVSVAYARRRGPNAADDLIVELVSEADTDDVVVTSDRDLRRRVGEHGAATVGAAELLGRIEALES